MEIADKEMEEKSQRHVPSEASERMRKRWINMIAAKRDSEGKENKLKKCGRESPKVTAILLLLDNKQTSKYMDFLKRREVEILWECWISQTEVSMQNLIKAMLFKAI